MHPPNYEKIQISPVIKNNDMGKEVVWTYLVARKFNDENNHATLAQILCGDDKMITENSKIWLEAYLQPTREREGEIWKTRADLAIGCIEKNDGSKLQIRSSGNSVCICEAKYGSDIHYNKKYPVDQLARVIEHAILLHDQQAIYPEHVYVTLITPQSFWNQDRDYQNIYEKYEKDKSLIAKHLQTCDLKFKNHIDYDFLKERLSRLKFKRVTFEKLLGLSDPVTEFKTWKEVLIKIKREDLFDKLTKQLIKP